MPTNRTKSVANVADVTTYITINLAVSLVQHFVPLYLQAGRYTVRRKTLVGYQSIEISIILRRRPTLRHGGLCAQVWNEGQLQSTRPCTWPGASVLFGLASSPSLVRNSSALLLEQLWQYSLFSVLICRFSLSHVLFKHTGELNRRLKASCLYPLLNVILRYAVVYALQGLLPKMSKMLPLT